MLPVQMLLHGKVHHLGIGPGTMPMLLLRRDPDGIARADLAHGTTPQLHASHPGDDMESLTERMGMPCGARTGFETHPRTSDSRRGGRLDNRVLPYSAGERFRGPTSR